MIYWISGYVFPRTIRCVGGRSFVSSCVLMKRSVLFSREALFVWTESIIVSVSVFGVCSLFTKTDSSLVWNPSCNKSVSHPELIFFYFLFFSINFSYFSPERKTNFPLRAAIDNWAGPTGPQNKLTEHPAVCVMSSKVIQWTSSRPPYPGGKKAPMILAPIGFLSKSGTVSRSSGLRQRRPLVTPHIHWAPNIRTKQHSNQPDQRVSTSDENNNNSLWHMLSSTSSIVLPSDWSVGPLTWDVPCCLCPETQTSRTDGRCEQQRLKHKTWINDTPGRRPKTEDRRPRSEVRLVLFQVTK